MAATERVSGVESTILIPDVGGITCLTRTEAYWICTLKPTSYPGLNEEFSVFLFLQLPWSFIRVIVFVVE